MESPLLPQELLESLQRSIDAAKEVQSGLSGLPQNVASKMPLETLVQAHTAHLLNHVSMLKRAAEILGNENPVSAAALQTMVVASEQMLIDARSLNERILSIQLAKRRGLKPATSTSESSRYKAPSVEELDGHNSPIEGGDNSNNTRESAPNKGDKKTEAFGYEGSESKGSPKRRLDGDEVSQSLVKRTKLDRTQIQSEKRKSDISMADAEDSSSETSPPTKRRKRDETPLEGPLPHVQIEYEDITEEVAARMQKHKERREREMRQELGIADKRKRQSNDSFVVELGEEETISKPSRKKKKQTHTCPGKHD
ncbi:uncharacterized protein PV09_05328 [Verruconis gallopava]|uniref:Uncharacterized protein n=1 Tax=Verruconis gallopava TaxID=253628 RepID=A0A0D2AA15_9PEZI|nr:uncharacterized protein PV09_05328 [Verruconis gallopava]KIW03573.1 hypothetical protein PV09_05328 [Verruconis gallopava]